MVAGGEARAGGILDLDGDRGELSARRDTRRPRLEGEPGGNGRFAGITAC
jgi:hypothetical protein